MVNLVINRREFLNSLNIGGSFSGKNRALAILDMVECVFEPFCTACSVASFDGQNYVRHTGYDCKNESNEKVVFQVNTAEILSVLKSIDDETITFSIEDTTLVIKHKKGKMSLCITKSTEFPTLSAGEKISEFSLPSAMLNEWFSISRMFVSTDNLKPILSAIHLYVKDGFLGVCATDSLKLYSDSSSIGELSKMDVKMNIPATCASSLCALFASLGSENVNIALYERHVSFFSSQCEIICLCLEGRFPNFEAVIPKQSSISIDVNTKELRTSINRVTTCANANTLTKLCINGMMATISSEDIDFAKSATDNIVCTHLGEDLTIGMSGKVLTTCLSTVASENVTLLFNAPNTPILIKDDGKPSQKVLLMPLMLA